MGIVVDETRKAAFIASFIGMGGSQHEAERAFETHFGHAEPSSGDNPGEPSQQALDLLGDPAGPRPRAANDPLAQKRPRGRPAKAVEVTQRELDLFDLSLEIERVNARESGQLGFVNTAMVYASMPYREVKGVEYKRTVGNLRLSILSPSDVGLPYGKMPRIILAYLCSQAKRFPDRGPTIDLGASQAEFATRLGLNTGGGKRGDVSRLREQADRLFSSTINLRGTPGTDIHWNNVVITRNGMLLWNPQDAGARARWNSALTLSLDFFEDCIQHAIPIDMRVLQKLRSPMAIDLYVWMTYRYHSIVVPTPIGWRQLKAQFGTGYADDEQGAWNFIADFKKQLRAVSAVYREAKFNLDRYKFTLLPSPPHILPAPEAA